MLRPAGLVGQTVYVNADEFQLGEDVQNGKIELAHSSNQVTLVVKDEFGQSTKVPLGAHGKGDVDFSINPEELGLKPGKYSVAVEVQEGQASPNVLMAGTVEQVRIPNTGGAALSWPFVAVSPAFYAITFQHSQTSSSTIKMH